MMPLEKIGTIDKDFEVVVEIAAIICHDLLISSSF
jgi:hypothetical protein